jgi:outer membrane biosynthesis protein TonB
VLLAAAVVIGSTIVAVSGSVGGGVLQVVYTRDQRIFTWLLQVSTAAALIVTWLLAGTRLGERAPLTPGEQVAGADLPTAQDGEVDPDLVELSDAPPIPPAPVPLHRHEPEPEIEPEPEQPAPVPRPAPVTRQPPADPKPATTSATAQRVFQERLAYSPKRDEARRLLEEIARAEREGRADDAAALAAQLDVM